VNKPAREYLGHHSVAVEKAATAIKKVSSERTSAQTTVQYVLHHPAVTSAVVGMRTMDQLLEVLETTNVGKLSKEEYLFLQQSVPANLYDLHR